MATALCPFAFRRGFGETIHCGKRNEQGKWDFCTKQYFCGVSRRWEQAENAAECERRKEGETTDGDGVE